MRCCTPCRSRVISLRKDAGGHVMRDPPIVADIAKHHRRSIREVCLNLVPRGLIPRCQGLQSKVVVGFLGAKATPPVGVVRWLAAPSKAKEGVHCGRATPLDEGKAQLLLRAVRITALIHERNQGKPLAIRVFASTHPILSHALPARRAKDPSANAVRTFKVSSGSDMQDSQDITKASLNTSHKANAFRLEG